MLAAVAAGQSARRLRFTGALNLTIRSAAAER